MPKVFHTLVRQIMTVYVSLLFLDNPPSPIIKSILGQNVEFYTKYKVFCKTSQGFGTKDVFRSYCYEWRKVLSILLLCRSRKSHRCEPVLIRLNVQCTCADYNTSKEWLQSSRAYGCHILPSLSPSLFTASFPHYVSSHFWKTITAITIEAPVTAGGEKNTPGNEARQQCTR